ncbi:D-arabinono-1,4-lactone oxidase [Bacillus sp. 123MFChir2]|uniref:D-arabinono-1,4-lactone oxidase n=1 Tax=Bacillus sp. 123MFChir2 TaxID=1169144 RepID=UPI00037F8826|nr:D-arabinono-1,4-lactone oxidase [Bacillus sp. 123MFChir2]
MLSIKGQRWRNWTGNVQGVPQYTMYPKSIEEVTQAVEFAKEAGKRIRVVGSGHSFTSLVQTDEILISLDKLQGMIEINSQTLIVEVWAGTKLFQLGEILQENLGDIDAQSIAGAISTGTHGTGISFGNLATQVVEVTAVLASGEVITCSEKEYPQYWKGFQLSLGMLGIIVKVKLKVIPAYSLAYESKKESFATVMSKLEEYKKNRHFEFFIFPYSDDVQVKITNVTEEVGGELKWHKLKTALIENMAFSLLSEGCRFFPSISKSVSQLSAKGVPNTKIVGQSYKVFATARNVRFYEMEYSIPAEYMKEAVEEIYNLIYEKKFQVHFPIECRYAKEDDIWLSPSYGRDSAYIAVHMYKGMQYTSYFQAVERIFQKYEGRPHWGKMHTMKYDTLQQVYPKLPHFLELRQTVDPTAMFLNPYLAKMFLVE